MPFLVRRNQFGPTLATHIALADIWWPDRFWPSDRPPSDRPKFRAFFPSPAPIFILFFSLWGYSCVFFLSPGVFSCLFSSLWRSSRGFWSCLGRSGPQMCLFSPLGCRVEGPGGLQAPPFGPPTLFLGPPFGPPPFEPHTCSVFGPPSPPLPFPRPYPSPTPPHPQKCPQLTEAKVGQTVTKVGRGRSRSWPKQVGQSRSWPK